MHLPVGRNGYFGPFADIVFWLVKIHGPVGGFIHPVEFPTAVQRLIKLRHLAVGFEGFFHVKIWNQGTVTRLFVYADDFGVFPFGIALGRLGIAGAKRIATDKRK